MDTVDDVPVVLSYRFLRAGVEETFVLPQLQLVDLTSSFSLSCRFLWSSLFGGPYRFRRCSLRRVVDVPVLQVVLDSCAVVKETVEISQLLLLRNRWLPVILAALRGGVGMKVFFKGPVHRYRAGGRVHRDTAPITRCIY